MELSIGVLTISDRVSKGEMEDLGASSVEEALGELQPHVTHRAVVSDDADRIAEVLQTWSDSEGVDVILTTGGTGLGPRDVTPEATERVAHRLVPGIAETLRSTGLRQTPFSMLSRGRSVVRGTTLIVNLPGSPSGAREGVEVLVPILTHAVAILRGERH